MAQTQTQSGLGLGLPIIVFVIYRLIILAIRILAFYPLGKEWDPGCDPTMQIINLIKESLNPENLTYGLFFTKFTIFALLIFIILKYSATHFFIAYIYHTWNFLFFMYIANAICYSLFRWLSSGFCYTLNNDFFDYGSMIFVAIFAIKASFERFANLDKETNKKVTFPVGWLILFTTMLYYIYIGVISVIYNIEAWLYKLMYDQNSDGTGIFQQFITYMMILNEPTNIINMLINFFLTPMNIAGIITVGVLIVYLIMKEDRKKKDKNNEEDEESIKSKERLERLHSIIYGCIMILFFTLTLLMFFISGDVLDSDKKVFYISSAVLIILCIILSVYRQKKIKEKESSDIA